MIADESLKIFLEAYSATRDPGAARAASLPSSVPTREELYLIRPPTRPYPGLRSFEPREEQIFFGRDRQADAVRDRLASCNVVVVLGGSGSGKSSLVRAGVLPKLNSTGRILGREGRWYATEFRPGQTPSDSFFDALWLGVCVKTFGALPKGWEALASSFKISAPTDQIENQCKEHLRTLLTPKISGDGHRLSSTGLADFVNRVLKTADEYVAKSRRSLVAGPANLFILVDQFEEYFRPKVDRRECSDIVEMLRLAQNGSNAHLFFAVTLRSEELHRCSEIEGLADIVNRGSYLLDFMNRDDLRESIIQPARRSLGGWRIALGKEDSSPFQDEFVEEILNWTEGFASKTGPLQTGANKADMLPLLQHMLRVTWTSAIERWKASSSPDLLIKRSDLDHSMEKWRKQALEFRHWLLTTEPEFKETTKEDWSRTLLPKWIWSLLRPLLPNGSAGVNRGNDHSSEPLVSVQSPNPLSECLDLAATITLRGSVLRADNGEGFSYDINRLYLVQAAFTVLATRDDRGNVARRPAKVTEILNVAKVRDSQKSRQMLGDALLSFEQRAFLLRRYEQNTFRYDISHEAFARTSSDCVRWMSESEDVRQALVRVRAAVREGDQAEQRNWIERVVDRWLLKPSERASTMVSSETGIKLERVFGDGAIFDKEWAKKDAGLTQEDILKVETAWLRAKRWRNGGDRQAAQKRIAVSIASPLVLLSFLVVFAIAKGKLQQTNEELTDTVRQLDDATRALNYASMAGRAATFVPGRANFVTRKELAAAISGLISDQQRTSAAQRGNEAHADPQGSDEKSEPSDNHANMDPTSRLALVLAAGTMDNAARNHIKQVDAVVGQSLPVEAEGWMPLECLVTNSKGEPLNWNGIIPRKPQDGRAFAWAYPAQARSQTLGARADRFWRPVTTNEGNAAASFNVGNMVDGLTVACPTPKLDYIFVWNLDQNRPPEIWPVLWTRISKGKKSSWWAAQDQPLTIRSYFDDESQDVFLRDAASKVSQLAKKSLEPDGRIPAIFSRQRNATLEFLIPFDENRSARLSLVVGYYYPILLGTKQDNLEPGLKILLGNTQDNLEPGLKLCAPRPPSAENVLFECKVDLRTGLPAPDQAVSLLVRSRTLNRDGQDTDRANELEGCQNATAACANEVVISSRGVPVPSKNMLVKPSSRNPPEVAGSTEILRAKVDTLISPVVRRAGFWQGDLYLEDAAQQLWRIAFDIRKMKEAVDQMPTPEVRTAETSQLCQALDCLSFLKDGGAGR